MNAFACAVAPLALLAACGGVNHKVRKELPAPDTVAVLPFGGPAAVTAREGARALLHSRLLTRGYHLVEIAWVDRVLAERGWLRDPAAFDPKKLPLPEVFAALGVDALAVGDDVDETSFNVLLLRRHAFGGTVALHRRDGVWWSANHAASTLGGFLLTSGQVFEELRAQGNHGTPLATLALVDEFVTDVAATVPMREAAARKDSDPAVTDVAVKRTNGESGQQRLEVEAKAPPGATLRFELDPYIAGVPMVALPKQPTVYRGSQDVPANTPVEKVVVRARSAYGREVRVEVKP